MCSFYSSRPNSLEQQDRFLLATRDQSPTAQNVEGTASVTPVVVAVPSTELSHAEVKARGEREKQETSIRESRVVVLSVAIIEMKMKENLLTAIGTFWNSLSK